MLVSEWFTSATKNPSARSKTASMTSVMFAKWWYRAPRVMPDASLSDVVVTLVNPCNAKSSVATSTNR
ncbi:Uncharacterised protein [Mycobacteroides abscessus subsp. abscessus]|nr:Uncharacterised protein [Mycobacteroides abscessus subsp. abscessus]